MPKSYISVRPTAFASSEQDRALLDAVKALSFSTGSPSKAVADAMDALRRGANPSIISDTAHCPVIIMAAGANCPDLVASLITSGADIYNNTYKELDIFNYHDIISDSQVQSALNKCSAPLYKAPEIVSARTYPHTPSPSPASVISSVAAARAVAAPTDPKRAPIITPNPTIEQVTDTDKAASAASGASPSLGTVHAAVTSGNTKDILHSLNGFDVSPIGLPYDTTIGTTTVTSATLLHSATFRTDEHATGIMNLMINEGEEVNARYAVRMTSEPRTRIGLTALYHATVLGDIDKFQLLTDNGADRTVTHAAVRGENTYEGISLAHTAIEYRQLHLLPLLPPEILNAGYTMTTLTGEEYKNVTPLQMAVDQGNMAAVNALIRAGAEMSPVCTITPRSSTTEQTSPLHTAVHTGRLDIIDALCTAGAAVNLPDHLGRTPMDYAILTDNLDVAKYLKSRGATVSDDSAMKAEMGQHVSTALQNFNNHNLFLTDEISASNIGYRGEQKRIAQEWVALDAPIPEQTETFIYRGPIERLRGQTVGYTAETKAFITGELKDAKPSLLSRFGLGGGASSDRAPGYSWAARSKVTSPEGPPPPRR